MILRFSPFSPFSRKVQIASEVLGLSDRVTAVFADPADENDPLRAENPLGKVPALILDDGTALFDSPVIVEYLDTLAINPSVIPKGLRRFEALRTQALADGLLDAAILQISERRFRPKEQRNAAWVELQAAKVERALTALEAKAHHFDPKTPDIGQISVACALGYLDFRFKGAWREKLPALVAFLATFAETVPMFKQTQPQIAGPT